MIKLRLRRRFGPVMALAATATLWAPASSLAAGADHALPACSRDEVGQRVRTDQERYAPGQPVVVKLVATNLSDHDCAMPSTASVRVRPASGSTVWHAAVAVDWIRGTRWRSGRSVTWNFTWDQHTCTSTDCSGMASPGTYVAVAGWESYRPATARFIINGIK
jgi:hypothetical protein